MTKPQKPDVTRVVEMFESHPPVVHYRCSAPKNISGQRLLSELIAAAIPDYDRELALPKDLKKKLTELGFLTDGSGVPRTTVTVYPNDNVDMLDVAVPYDIVADRSPIVAAVVAEHLGGNHPDEKALIGFAQNVRASAQKLIDGRELPPQELAVVMACLAKQLV